MKAKLFIIGIILFSSLSAGCARQEQTLDSKLDAITAAYRFNIPGWTMDNLMSLIRPVTRAEEQNDGSALVMELFSLANQITQLKDEYARAVIDHNILSARLADAESRKAELSNKVGDIIRIQIVETLNEEGIFNPIDTVTGPRFNFPPLTFKLQNPPSLLVVSPRDRIERAKDILLKPGIKPDQVTEVEDAVDSLNVSSIVIQIGGVATFPSFVPDNLGVHFALRAITEEWVHQYLAFKPLGFLYLLNVTDIWRDNDIATINETVAGIISDEIGDKVYRKYYAKYETPNRIPAKPPEIDFYKEMRELRKAVDGYLEQGQIETAEQLMESKRLYLASKGYFIRKLNQAYFAFYGTYLDGPGFVSPIGDVVVELRKQSSSLRDFLAKASSLRSFDQLQATVNMLKAQANK